MQLVLSLVALFALFALVTCQHGGVQPREDTVRPPEPQPLATVGQLDSPPEKGILPTDTELDHPGAAFPLATLVGKDLEGVEFVGTRKTSDDRSAGGALCTELVFRNKSPEARILIISYLEKNRLSQGTEPSFTLRETRKRLHPGVGPQFHPLCLARTLRAGTTTTGPVGLMVGREVTFAGRISKIHFGVAYDGSNYMVIDGKHVVFADANAPTYFVLENQAQGRIIGFKFRAGHTNDSNRYLGKTAKVFALALPSHGGMETPFIYTLYGDAAYTIELQ